MKILLINPPNCGRSIPEERFGITSIKQIFRGEPLALEVLAGNLHGHEVVILDLKVEPDALAERLATLRPDLVGITAVTCEANSACRIAAAAKACCGATVVVGGIHASNDPGFFHRDGIDFIVVGLGKGSFRELVDALERGERAPVIPGVAVVRPGAALRYTPRVFGPRDLVEERPPRYDLVAANRHAYTLLGLPMGFVASAFGCPFDCNFCCIAGQAGGRYLACSIAAVIRDIGISVVGDYIISPDYDHADFDNLLRYMQENPVALPIFTVLTPLPGTALHRDMRARIVNHDLDYYTLSNAVVPTRLPEEEFYRRYAELFHLTHPQAKI